MYIHPVFIQAFYYFVVVVLAVVFAGFIQRGFFFKFMRVRLSFGKYVLVKLREVNRDFFSVGNINEGFLIYKVKKETKRLKVPKEYPVLYKSIGITWVDIDNEKNAFCTVNYEAVEGFDAVKYQDLYLRALYKPQIRNNQELIIMILVILAVVGIAVLIYQNTQDAKILKTVLSQINSINTGLVTSGAPLT